MPYPIFTLISLIGVGKQFGPLNEFSNALPPDCSKPPSKAPQSASFGPWPPSSKSWAQPPLVLHQSPKVRRSDDSANSFCAFF